MRYIHHGLLKRTWYFIDIIDGRDQEYVYNRCRSELHTGVTGERYLPKSGLRDPVHTHDRVDTRILANLPGSMMHRLISHHEDFDGFLEWPIHSLFDNNLIQYYGYK